MLEQLVRRQADVLGNLAQQNRGQVSARMVWDRRLPAIGVPELAMRPALANLNETQPLEEAYDFPGFEHGQAVHDGVKR